MFRRFVLGAIIVFGQGPATTGFAQENLSEKAQAERPLASTEGPVNSSFEIWMRETVQPWLLCAGAGTYFYAKYLLDKSDWNLIPLSKFLEESDCFFRDFAWAADIYRAGARAGKQVHALYFGHLYLNGLGVERNADEAQRWFDLAVLFQAQMTPERQLKHLNEIMGYRGIAPELIKAIRNVRHMMQGHGIDIDYIAKSLWHGSDGMKVNREAAAELHGIAHYARNRRHEDKIRYWNTLLENGFDTSDPKVRKSEIYWALQGIYNEATLGRHAPSQEIIAEVFEAGELVDRDPLIAYVFFRLAQKKGVDVAEKIEKIRPELSAEQIAEAENDVREGKQEQYNYRDIRDKKLPPYP